MGKKKKQTLNTADIFHNRAKSSEKKIANLF